MLIFMEALAQTPNQSYENVLSDESNAAN